MGMNPDELAKRLAHMYDNAREGETATMVHLFGIHYADELRRCRERPSAIAKRAGLGESYGTEINKGMNLARYVTEKRR